jgi:adenylyl-sulfate kinase
MSGHIFFFTGLSGSGKTTIAEGVMDRLPHPKIILDGDMVRKTICRDLGFSAKDRKENMRRVMELARLMYNMDFNVFCTFVAPDRNVRELCKYAFENFHEIYVQCPLSTVVKRDTKGLYAKAQKGQLKNLAGYNTFYETPSNPSLTINTHILTKNQAIQVVLEYVQNNI